MPAKQNTLSSQLLTPALKNESSDKARNLESAAVEMRVGSVDDRMALMTLFIMYLTWWPLPENPGGSFSLILVSGRVICFYITV